MYHIERDLFLRPHFRKMYEDPRLSRTTVKRGGFTMYVNDTPLAGEILSQPEKLIPLFDEGVIFKGKRDGTIVAAAPFAGRQVLLKRICYSEERAMNRIRYLITEPRSSFANLGARLVTAAGVGTPAVYAFGHEKRGPVLVRSYLVSEFMEGVQLLSAIVVQGRRDPLSVLGSAVALIRKLHGAGLTHGDANFWNIYEDRNGKLGVWDLDSFCLFSGTPPLAARMRDLGQIMTSLLINLDASANETHAALLSDAKSLVAEAARLYGVTFDELHKRMHDYGLDNHVLKHPMRL